MKYFRKPVIRAIHSLSGNFWYLKSGLARINQDDRLLDYLRVIGSHSMSESYSLIVSRFGYPGSYKLFQRHIDRLVVAKKVFIEYNKSFKEVHVQ